jgi:hypothetical protein
MSKELYTEFGFPGKYPAIADHWLDLGKFSDAAYEAELEKVSMIELARAYCNLVEAKKALNWAGYKLTSREKFGRRRTLDEAILRTTDVNIKAVKAKDKLKKRNDKKQDNIFLMFFNEY